MTHRPRVIIGNWKMHKSADEAKAFVRAFLAAFPWPAEAIVGLAVSFTLIAPVVKEATDSPLWIGAQNMNDASEGAFTGEIAGPMLKDAGASFVLLGHSERRRYYGEEDAFINRKVRQALACGIKPVLCVGETQEERSSQSTDRVLETQLTLGLSHVLPEEAEQLIVAYEPVWAIGQRESASREEIKQAHGHCRAILKELFGPAAADKIAILYGGSVSASNAKVLLGVDDVDGLLVGGASLCLENFLKIVNDSLLT